METCVLIPGQHTSYVVLNGLKITMPASKNELGLELGDLICRIMEDRLLRTVHVEQDRMVLTLSRTISIEQARMISMIDRATSIINDNPDIVVRVTE
jgi:hypothetical protein